jgi:TPR repeat protein
MTTPLEQAREAIATHQYEQAAELLKPLTNTGDAEADYLYGSLLFCGPDVVDVDDAMEAFERAAELDHPAACYAVATTSIDEAGAWITGPVVDRDLLVHAAELGDVAAQRAVGVLHVDGEDGFPQDLTITRHWYERAAEQGDANSQFDLGWMMLAGEGGPVDLEGGLQWLETCAMQEDENELSVCTNAADFLAAIFEEGRFDLEPDPETSQRWRERHRELTERHEQLKLQHQEDLAQLAQSDERRDNPGNSGD